MIAASAQNLYTLAMGSTPPRVAANPTIRRRSEKGNVRKAFFEPAEFAAVVKALPEYLQDVARFAYLTGWRRGDMLGLRWLARLAQRRDGEPVVADLVFHNRGHRIVDYRRAWAKACKAAGFVYRVVNEKTGRRELGRRMHDLRRTATRDRVHDNTPERVVMPWSTRRSSPTRPALDCVE